MRHNTGIYWITWWTPWGNTHTHWKHGWVLSVWDKLCHKIAIKNHMNTEHIQECEVCNERFKSKAQLKSHIASKHVVKCTYCSCEPKSQDDLNSHIEYEHNLHCNVCTHKVHSREALEQHRSCAFPHVQVLSNWSWKRRESWKPCTVESHLQMWYLWLLVKVKRLWKTTFLIIMLSQIETTFTNAMSALFKSNIKDNLGRHYKETHGSKSKEARQNKPNNEDRENCQLESELRKLKNCQWRGTRKTALPDQPGGQYLLWAGSSRRWNTYRGDGGVDQLQ